MLLENIDVFAERPRMGLQRVTEVIALGEHNWVSMRSGITKQDTLEQQEPVQMWRRDLNPR
ncbi:MAG: hypothetical protein ACI88H_004214, partial [Cocleimonas sp.]